MRPAQLEKRAEPLENYIAKAISRLDPARRAQVQAICDSAPKSARRGYLKTMRGRASPRFAMKIMCLHCMGWVRAEVPLCTARGCPLWAYRQTADQQVAADEA
jgi:hypothetical protein